MKTVDNLFKLATGMWITGKLLGSQNKETQLIKEYEYNYPFKLPMLNHPAWGNTFIYHKSKNNNTKKAKNIAYEICEYIADIKGIELVPVYHKLAANVIKIKLKPRNEIKKSFSLQREIKYITKNEETKIYPEGDKIVIEIPNKGETVRFGDFMHDEKYILNEVKTVVPIGQNVDGEIIYGDIAKMPHMLVAGTTGSGKSVFINGIITSLLMKNNPYDLNMILIDPKMVEFKRYSTLKYVRYITQTEEAINILELLCNEMDKRYQIMANEGCKDIDTYNKRFPNKRYPKIVLVIDEMADMMIDRKKGKDVEKNIIRIAQKARASGIHMILATQRPTSNIITGLIKANIPCRICLSVATKIDSMVIIDQTGGEKLQGNGDLLYIDGKNKNPQRLQAGLITDEEICNVTLALALDNQKESLEKMDFNNQPEEVREYYRR